MGKLTSCILVTYQTLFDCFEIIDRTTKQPFAKAKTWHSLNTIIAIDSTKVNTYNASINAIFYGNKIISSRYLFETFNKKIDNFIIALIKENLIIDTPSIKQFGKSLIDADEFHDTIMTPIYGVSLGSKDHLEFGPFEIFDISKSKHINQDRFEAPDQGVYISIADIRHSDTELAYHKALLKFVEFKYIVHYLIGHKSEKYLVKFGTREQPDQNERHIFTDSIDRFLIRQNAIVGSSMENKIIEPIDISDPFFVSDETGNDKTWKLYTDYHKGTNTKLGHRIIRSIITAGKSISSLDISDAFVSLIIAYEILLSYDDNSLFSKSIGQNLSDSFALLLDDNLENRKSISSEIKKFYSIRSALVHSAGKNPTPLQFQTALNFLQQLIRLLLTDKKINGFKTIEELNSHINDLKFS